MNFKRKKELAAKTFNVGKDRIILVKERKDDLKEAISREDMRQLKNDGAIKIKEKKGRTKVRKGKRRTTGNVRKKVKTRKRDYVLLTRKLRKYIKELEKHGKITKQEKKELRKKIRDKDFKSQAQLKEYIQNR
ncbi:MAG TPA: 50S ribosomal protein L19e [Candidatus Nanoarchaeia archaeon]|nr:50S ribosomal protein L19e [Candidatus Nanoarchaeia archaeon]